jgi:hypothetical protein
MLAYMTIPVSESVIAKSENGLNRIAYNACGEHTRGTVDDGMLVNRTVLIFIDEKTGVGSLNDIVDMPCLQKPPRGCSYGRIIRPLAFNCGGIIP